jgi:hypothetical protein
MPETEMGFGSGCLTVARTRSAVPHHGATQSERGQVDTQDQTPSLIKADSRDVFFAAIVVGRLEEAFMLTGPLRQAFCAICRGPGMEGTFPHFTFTFTINLSNLPFLATQSTLSPLLSILPLTNLTVLDLRLPRIS